MARWRSLLLCAALVASAGFTAAAAEEAADAAADPGPAPEFAKMRVKELQGLIAARGEECKGCSEKADLVARAAEVWHLPIKAAPEEKKEKTPPNKDDVEAVLRDLKIKMPGMKVFGKDDMEKMRREMGDKKFAAGAGAGEL